MDPTTALKVNDFFAAYPGQTYAKRQLIIEPGDLPGHVFYLAEGRVSQYDITANGNEIVVNVFKPGAFFPMSSVINNVPSGYFFETSVKTVLRRAPAAEVIAFLRDNPDVTYNLLSRVYRGVDGVLRRMAHLMGGDAKSRLVFELLNAASRFGEIKEDGTVHITLREHDLARHSGLARETVSRNLASLKAEGLVKITSHGITIVNTAQLENLLSSPS